MALSLVAFRTRQVMPSHQKDRHAENAALFPCAPQLRKVTSKQPGISSATPQENSAPGISFGYHFESACTRMTRHNFESMRHKPFHTIPLHSFAFHIIHHHSIHSGFQYLSMAMQSEAPGPRDLCLPRSLGVSRRERPCAEALSESVPWRSWSRSTINLFLPPLKALNISFKQILTGPSKWFHGLPTPCSRC